MRIPLFTILLLSACTSIVPLTAMRLNSVSPLTADPADFAVDLTLPDGIDVRPGSAQMNFTIIRTDTNQDAQETFVLQREGSVFRLNPKDHDALRALQAKAAQWDASNADATEGSLSITLAPCRHGTGPAPGATVSVAVQIAEDGDFFPLVRNGPLSAVTSEEQLRDMPSCP